MQTKIRLVTNVLKSQISDDGEFFRLKGIPVTVDGAVMNGLLYRAEDNAKGMPSIVNRVMTLGHPKNDSGEFVSATDGEALVNQFSGGSIEKTYLKNGVHYVDAKIRKSTLKSQPNGGWYYNRLNNQESIGVSTGLFSTRELTEGVTNSGQKYYGIATNQNYDHLALLHESEPPAGGKDTFINFNAEQNEYVVNVDQVLECVDVDEPLVNRIYNKIKTKLKLTNREGEGYRDTERTIASKLRSEYDEPIWPDEIYDDFFIYEKDGTMLKQAYSIDNGVVEFIGEPSTVVRKVTYEDLQTNEDDATMRQFIIEQLTAKGISVNAEMTDDQLKAELTKAMAANEADDSKSDAVLDAVNSLTKIVESLQNEMKAIKDEKADAEEADKKKKAKAVANADLGLSEEDAMLLPNAQLDKLYATKCSTITGNAFAGNPEINSKSTLTDYQFPE